MLVVTSSRMRGSPGTGGSSRESTPPRWWTTWTATPAGTMIVMLPGRGEQFGDAGVKAALVDAAGGVQLLQKLRRPVLGVLAHDRHLVRTCRSAGTGRTAPRCDRRR